MLGCNFFNRCGIQRSTGPLGLNACCTCQWDRAFWQIEHRRPGRIVGPTAGCFAKWSQLLNCFKTDARHLNWIPQGTTGHLELWKNCHIGQTCITQRRRNSQTDSRSLNQIKKQTCLCPCYFSSWSVGSILIRLVECNTRSCLFFPQVWPSMHRGTVLYRMTRNETKIGRQPYLN